MLTIHVGNCLEILRTLPDESVQTCVTSPPYFALRDYGTSSWFGGTPGCSHLHRDTHRNKTGKSHHSSSTTAPTLWHRCKHCGAVRETQELGLEADPEDFIANLVAVFDQVRRVLRPDGVLWLNIGDTYNSHGTARGKQPVSKRKTELPVNKSLVKRLPPKSLLGIPWRVAFAMQSSGWILRQDLIWAKPNPMPESVRDRCTRAHEYVFMFTKKPNYYWNTQAAHEPATYAGKTRGASKRRYDPCNGASMERKVYDKRNRRSVWHIRPATGRTAGKKHHATFPEELPRRCILAATREGDTVLDPFAGSGTTGIVAAKYGRHAILIELNPEYADLIRSRAAAITDLFTNP